MRKYFCILVCALFVLTATFGQAFAADMEDCAWPQPADLTSKWVIKKAGKDTGYDRAIFDIWYYVPDISRTTGYMWINLPDTPVDILSGELVLEKGKKLLFTIDSDGYDLLADALAQWLYEISLQEDFVITDPTVYFTFIIPPKPSKMKVDKITGDLIKKAKLKIKGLVTAQIFGVWVERKFKLTAKGEF